MTRSSEQVSGHNIPDLSSRLPIELGHLLSNDKIPCFLLDIQRSPNSANPYPTFHRIFPVSAEKDRCVARCGAYMETCSLPIVSLGDMLLVSWKVEEIYTGERHIVQPQSGEALSHDHVTHPIVYVKGEIGKIINYLSSEYDDTRHVFLPSEDMRSLQQAGSPNLYLSMRFLMQKALHQASHITSLSNI